MTRVKVKRTMGRQTTPTKKDLLSRVGDLWEAGEPVRRLVTRWVSKGKLITDDGMLVVSGIYRTGQKNLGKRLEQIGNYAEVGMEKVLHTFRLASVGDIHDLQVRVERLNGKLKKVEKKR